MNEEGKVEHVRTFKLTRPLDFHLVWALTGADCAVMCRDPSDSRRKLG